jgi:2-dehydropantoate 2-reductase
VPDAGCRPDIELAVIADGARAERIRRDGVTVNGVLHHLPVVSPDTPAAQGTPDAPADVVLFAVKGAALPQAIEAAQAWIGPDTIVLSLLNGISSESDIRQATGSAHVLLSLAIGIDAVRVGSQVTYTSLGRIEFGDDAPAGTAPSPTWRGCTPVRACRRAARGARRHAPGDVVQVPGQLRDQPGLRRARGALPRVPAARFPGAPGDARRPARGHRGGAGAAACRSTSTIWTPGSRCSDGLGPDSRTSMAQDVAAHRPTEVALFAGTLVPMGAELGVPTPVGRTLLDLIRAKEALWEDAAR